MTPGQIDLVRRSLAQATLLADQPAAVFLDRLHAQQPELCRQFIERHGFEAERGMRFLTSLIVLLDSPSQLHATLDLLGRRLPDRANLALQHQAVGTALMQTLEICLQSSFTPEVRAAWLALCSLAARGLAGRTPGRSLNVA